ncbi:hypothetical protein COHA_001144 [Chlorella ohadii]|uniref:Uncharacterized protein n=1 Tax=Chlorella ohadii TaxID=2649997 RepID=A0AAD5H654_9CHLO|nr:hypothetical protein COHA_001144 [Chlorella ohadii]
MNNPAAGAPAPAPGLQASSQHDGDGGFSLSGSPVFMACILAGCTALAVLLWVALAHQHKRITRARAKAEQAAAARRAALALPVIIVMPDDTAAFGAKLYRTPSGDMRPFSQFIRPAAPAEQPAQPDAASSVPAGAEQQQQPAAMAPAAL